MSSGAIRVVSDSACDLSIEMATEHHVDVVPLTVRFGDEEYVDRRDLSPAQFWQHLSSSTVLPETAAPSPGAFEEAFRAAAGAGSAGVVCVTISSALSATFQAAQLAAQNVASTLPVQVVDSRAVTMAQGNVVLRAARAAAEGASLEGVAAAARELVPRTRTYAALDTLENLKKGGRIGAAQALLGSMLSIKPIIQVADGKVEPESRQRTRGRSLRYLAEKVRQALPVSDVAVMHGAAPDVGVLIDLLSEFHAHDQILVGDVGAVIGTHAGPGVVGVTFIVASGH
ncbi:MAG TPA: DegV family protein [Acidimicrobiales bacterium]|nr:DegV family protein [Acidimicrobiales bacterium]